MATVFSTATLGLQVDASQFKKQIQDSEKIGTKALTQLAASADTFQTRWKDLTGGIKDTKRIISGILVSQGFYALSNALLNAASSAVTFSSSMETAGVSLEYFVDAAAGTENAAAQVQAYLREVNEFAARTPFSTDDVLSLSKYMQAVGVAMGQTQSVLEVITDTAAATGASTEQLQRITFALGQMITKGRIANEEIRQLANANIPIYQILQEELGLTGEQISNIGNYWIDANDAVVAILNGLNKRYDGASERIAETLSGLTDTIVDDAKIIADTAFGGIYDKVVGAAGTIRDVFDEWRTLTTAGGAGALANHFIAEVDPTGQLGNEILNLIGNARNLKEAVADLYHTAAPMLSLLGRTFAASTNVAMIAITALCKVIDIAVDGLESLGLTSSAAGQGIASLFIAYQATKFVSLLGQALVNAGMAGYQAASGIMALLPASLQANVGVVTLTASVAVLISYLLTAVSVFGMLNGSFSGLGASGEGLSKNWTDAYAAYKKQMEDYNAKIEKYRETYREPYTNMGDDYTGVKSEDDDDKDKSKGGSSGKSKTDWVAAFDEVYDVPNEDEDGTGAYQDAVLTDFGALLQLLDGIVFPNYDSTLEMPTLDLDDVFGDTLWDADYAGKDFWRAFLPATLLGLTTSIGTLLAKQKANRAKAATAGRPDLGGSTPHATLDTGTLKKMLAKQEDTLAKLLEEEAKRTKRLEGQFESAKKFGMQQTDQLLSADLESARLVSKDVENALKEYNKTAAQLQQPARGIAEHTQALRLQARVDNMLIQRRLDAITDQLKDSTLTQEVRQSLRDERKALVKQLRKAGNTGDIATKTAQELADDLTEQSAKLIDAFDDAFKGPLKQLATGTRVYNEKAISAAEKAFDSFSKTAEAYFAAADEGVKGIETAGTVIADQLRPELQNIRKSLSFLSENAGAVNGLRIANPTNTGANSGTFDNTKALLEAFDKADTRLRDVTRAIEQLPQKLQFEQIIENSRKAITRTLRAIPEMLNTPIVDQVNKVNAKLAAQQVRQREAAAMQQSLGERLLRAADATESSYVSAAEQMHEELANAQAALRQFTAQHEELLAERAWILKIREKGVRTDANEKRLAEISAELFDQADSITKATRTIEDLKASLNLGNIKLQGVKQLPSSSADGIAVVRQLQEALSSREMFGAPTLYTEAGKAIKTLTDGLDPAVRAVFKAAEKGYRGMLATGTSMVALNDGITAFGQTIPGLQRAMLANIGLAKAANDATSEYVKTTAAIGTNLEPFVRYAAANKFAGQLKTYGSGDLAAANKPLIIQTDAMVQLLGDIVNGKSTMSKLLTADIKTTSSDTIALLDKFAATTDSGLKEISADVLRTAHKDSWYNQFAAGIAANTAAGDDTRMVLLTFKRDYDIRSQSLGQLYEQWLRTIQQTVNNSNLKGYTDAVKGQIFSPAAISGYAELRGPAFAGLSSDLKTEAYFADILKPLFTKMVDGAETFDTGLLKAIADDAVDAYVVRYTTESIKQLADPAALAAYEHFNEALVTLGKAGVPLDDYLQSIIAITRDGTETFNYMSFDGVLRNYQKFNRNIARWFDSILGPGAGSFRYEGAFSKQLRNTIDQIVASLDITDPDSVTEYVEQLTKLRKASKALLAGEPVADDIATLFGKMAANPALYRTALGKLAEATNVLAEAPQLVDSTAAGIRDTIDLAGRINQKIAKGLPVTLREANSLQAGYQKTIEALALQGDEQARLLGDRLRSLRDYLSKADGELAVLAGDLATEINLPYRVLGVKEHAAAMMQQIVSDIDSSLIKGLSDTDQAIIKAAQKSAGESQVIIENGFKLIRQRLNDTAKTFFDIETAPRLDASGGVIPATGTVTAAGAKYPYIASIAASKQTDTGLEAFESFVNYGHEQNAANLKFLQDTFGKEAYPDKLIVQLDQADDLAKVLERFRAFSEGTRLSGYNAVNAGGFDLPIINYWAKALNQSQFDAIGEDVMRMLTERITKGLGSGKNLTLSAAADLFLGGRSGAAHLAGNDAAVTAALSNALQDGTVDNIIEAAKKLPGKNATERLAKAVQSLGGISEATADAADDVIDLTALLKKLSNGFVDADELTGGLSTFIENLDEANKEALRGGFSRGIEAANKAVAGIDELLATIDKVVSSHNGAASEELLKQIDELTAARAAAVKKISAYEQFASKLGVAGIPKVDAEIVTDIPHASYTSAADDVVIQIDAVVDDFVDSVTSSTKFSLNKLKTTLSDIGSWLKDKLSTIDFIGAKRAAAKVIKPLEDAAFDVATAHQAYAVALKEAAESGADGAKYAAQAKAGLENAWTDFYRSLYSYTNDVVKKGTYTLDEFLKAFDKNGKYLYYTFDDATHEMKLIGRSLSGTGNDFLRALRSVSDVSKTGDDAAKALSSALDAMLDAVDEGKPLAEAYGILADAQKEAFKKFMRGSVITNAAADVTYAGEEAAKAVSAAMDSLDTSLKASLKKFVFGTGAGYGALDVVMAGVDALIQKFQDVASEDYAAQFVVGSLSDEAQKAIQTAGVNTGKIVADSIYDGVTDTAVQSFLTAGISNVLVYAIGAAVGGIPGAVLGIASSVLATAGINSALGNDQYSLSVGNWSDLMEGESHKAYDTTFVEGLLADSDYTAADVRKIIAASRFTDVEKLYDALVDAGASSGEAAATALETALANYNFEAFDFAANTPMNTLRGRSEINEALYGSQSGTAGSLPTRILAATGAIDAASRVRSINVHGANLRYSDLVLGADNAQADLEKIKKATGNTELYLGELVEMSGKQYYVVRDPNAASTDNPTVGMQPTKNGTVTYYDGDYETLYSLLSATYSGGVQNSDIAGVLNEVVNGNAALVDALQNAGITASSVDAYNAIDTILASYNRLAGTKYTREDLDNHYQLAAGILDWGSQVRGAYEADKWAQADVISNGGTAEKNTQYVFGASLNGLEEALGALESVGLKVSEGSYNYSSKLTGDVTDSYVKLTTLPDVIMDNLRGMTIDLTGESFEMDGATIDLASMAVTAKEAEILAEAGIQFNGNGTVSAMYSSNEEKTGSTRALSLKEGSFNTELLDKMAAKGITLDFDTKSVDFGNFDKLADKTVAAYFAMSTDVENKVTDRMRKTLSSIGNITESGFFEITNKAILGGNSSMKAALDKLDWSGITLDVKDQLYNIAELVDKEGGTVQDNILEWANGIRIPSPFNESELTDEVKAGFAAVGVSFEEGADGLYMVISNTGEKLTNGITLINSDKWAELSETTLEALRTLGVSWTEVGNQTMVDLTGVYDAGIGQIVSLFVDQPDLWQQLPDTVKEVLGNVAVASGTELLEIQNLIDQNLVDVGTIVDSNLAEIGNGWITSWEALEPETRTALESTGLTVNNGMLQIKGYVEGAELPETVNEEALVPFSELPPEIQAYLEETGQNVEGMRYDLGEAVEVGFSDFQAALSSACDTAGGTATSMGDQIKQAVVDAMYQIQQLQSLQSQLGKSGGFLGLGSKDNYLGTPAEVGPKDAKVTYYPEYTAKGKLVTYWYQDDNGVWKSKKKLPGRASGGPATGYTLAGELGDEMVILPDGTIKWASAGVYNFPKGTQVINAKDSQAVAKYAGNVNSVEKLADGNTTLTVDPYGEETADTADSKGAYADFIEIYRPVLNEELSAVAELVATALDNSAKIIAEELKDTKNAAGDNTTSIISSISDAATSITGGLSGLQSSLNGALSSLRSSYSTMGMSASKASSSIDRSSLTGSVYDKAHFTDSELKAADSMRKAAEAGEASWKEAHEFVETIRNSYGYKGGDDGSKYIKDTNTAGKKIKANAFGGLATGDQLVRVGEFGKDEAILPLEQPSVMAQVGEAVGQYVGGITADELTAILDNELYTLQTQLSVALDNSAKIIAEELAENARSDAQNATDIKAALDGAVSSLSEGLTSIKDELGSLGSSISNAMSSLSSLSKGSNLAGGMGSSGGLDRKNLTGSAYDKAHFTDSELAAADALRKAAEAGEATWKEAHSFVESIRNSYGYSGGTDGSKYIKSTDKASSGKKIRANAYGGLITDDSLVRVGEYGKEEAVLPLEQPSVMAKLGTSIGKYTVQGTALTDEDIQALHSIFYTVVDEQTNQLSVALDNSAKIIGESLSGLSQDTKSMAVEVTGGLTGQTDALKAALSDLGSSISGSISSMASSISSAVSSAARANLAGSNLAGGAGAGSGGSGIDRSQYGGSVYDQAHFTDSELKAAASLRDAAAAGKISWSDAHKGVESIRNNYGYSGGTDGSKYNKKNNSSKKTKGSAKGSLVTEDALYRAGELGLNEAIIPLEKPEIMKYVGSTIASYMPVEAAGLEEALGMKNAGIAPTQRAANPYETDMTGLVNKVTQSVLESVLPAMSSMQSSNEATTPVYVGTLIADERGLKQLERKLYTIRKADEARRQ